MDSTQALAGPSTSSHVAGRVAVAMMTGVWLVALSLDLSRRIVLVPDSLNNHAHVWWIAENLWHHGTLPFRMPIIGHGAAFTFPYGVVNWTSAAILWPLLGDWGVTLWTAVGTVGCLAATFYVFPELRRGPWWVAAVLANPAAWYGLLFGQQTFVWSAAMLLFGIGLWRRNRPLLAAVMVGLAQANHPAVVLPIGLAVFVVWYVVARDDRGRLLRYYLVALAISAPAALVVLDSPVYADSTTRDVIFNFFSTVGPRILVIALPLAFVVMWRKWPRVAPAAFGLALVATVAMWWPLGASRTVPGILGRRHPDTYAIAAFVHSPVFQRGAMYRVLHAPTDAKISMYLLLRAGARSDSEFFPESMAHHSFKSTTRYGALLCARHIDYVLVFPSYDYTNEPALLQQAAKDQTSIGAARVRMVHGDLTSTLYAVDRAACPAHPTGRAELGT